MGVHNEIRFDFETRSQVSVVDVGAWAYSRHPSTQILCAAWKYPGDPHIYSWHRAHPDIEVPEEGRADLEELWRRLDEEPDLLMEAHNAFFERCVWRHVGTAREGWPEQPPVHRWRCSAAKSAAAGLPRALENAAKALRLRNKKDMQGHKTMLKCSRWRKDMWRKDRKTGIRRLTKPGGWNEDPLDLEFTWSYNRQDVRTEDELSSRVPDLIPQEQYMWELDQAINERGVAVDMEGVYRARMVVLRAKMEMNAEAAEITFDQDLGFSHVTALTQRQSVKKWCELQGVHLTDTQASTIDDVLAGKQRVCQGELPKDVRRLLFIMREANRTSTAKLEAMVDMVDPETGRAHGLFLFNGAFTGRWAGMIVQPHNLTRGKLKPHQVDSVWQTLHDDETLGAEAREMFYEAVETGRLPRSEWSWFQALYDTPMLTLSHAIRGAFVSAPGRELYVSDFAAIEARVLLWLAGDAKGLGVFERGEDIYVYMASDIYEEPYAAIMQRYKDKHQLGVDQRWLGKKAVLGLGYGMGWQRFFDECADEGRPVEVRLTKKVVETYRKETFTSVPALWDAYADTAIAAVESPGKVIASGKTKWGVVGEYLCCQLPSGRMLRYKDPSVRMSETPWGQMKPTLWFWGVGDTNQWIELTTWGGTLVENVDQAVARDLLAYSMVQAERSGFPIYMHVHDELISEREKSEAKAAKFDAVAARLPKWAAGLPMEAKGWKGDRYKKD